MTCENSLEYMYGKSNDIQDTARLLISNRGVTDNFEITEEFFAMESLKVKMQGGDLYDRDLRPTLQRYQIDLVPSLLMFWPSRSSAIF